VITKLETILILSLTGLTVADFHLLVILKVFNTERRSNAVLLFRSCDDASPRYTGLESRDGLTRYGIYNTIVSWE
jgi:hypothetical protein